MARLSVSLLGGFQVRLDGSAVPLPTRKSQALLAYLALTPGQAHPRDKLAALLWGGIRDESARASLRQALFSLRKALGEMGALAMEASAVALVPEAIDVDADLFARAVAAGSEESLARAAEIYRGDLLAGLVVDEAPWEEWLIGERERLRELAMEGLAKLLAHQRRSGAAEAAAQTALKLLALDPLQEPVHRVLMRLYAGLGRRGAALRQYQHCVTVLQRELGAAPEPETKQLYEEILRARPARVIAETQDAPRIDVLPSAHRSSAFVGRAAEIARLTEVLDQAAAGTGTVAAVLGEAGVGKSRLLAETAAEATARRFSVVTGRAYESEQILPFGPWADALRAAGIARDAPLLERVGSAWRSELARLLPELGNAPSDAGEPRRMFEAIVALLAHLAVDRPVLLVLEDLHWTDEISARLLAFVGRRLGGHRVLVIVSARGEELDDAGALARAFEEIDRDARLVRLPLSPLSRADSDTLVRALARSGRADDDLERLAARTWAVSEGNPFVIVEVVRATGEGEGSGESRSLTLPERVRELVSRRLAHLSDGSRGLVAVAAIIGREFDFSLLKEASGLDEHATANGVEELVRRGILHGAGEHFDFTHDRIRETVSAAILPPRRRLLHRQVAEALEAIHAASLDAHHVALGTHYRNAGVWDKAATYLSKAGSRASLQAAYREAVQLLEPALAALDHLAESPERDRRTLDVTGVLRSALTPIGELRRSLDVNQQGIALARRLGDDDWLASAMSGAAYALASIGDLAGAIRATEEAYTILDRIGQPDRKAAINAARLYYGVGDYERAVACARAEIEHFSGARLHERNRSGIVPAVRGRVWLTLCLAELGEFTDGAVVAGESLRLAQAIDFAHDQVWANVGAGRLLVVQGHFGRALAGLEPTLPRCRPGSELVIYFSRIAASLGLAYMHLGRAAEGLPLLEEAVAVGESIRFVYMQSLALACLAEGYVVAGRFGDASRVAAQAVDLARSQGHRGWEAWALCAAGDAALGAGDPDRAADAFGQAMALAEARGMRPLLAHCRLGLGGVAKWRGARAQAGEHVTAALAAYRAMAMAYWVERAEARFAQLP